jgi:hypothetical protein
MLSDTVDWVRLHANLSPPHWKEGTGDKWDDGYEKTAYFLNWLDKNYGTGTVVKINEILKDREYDEAIFQEITGRSVHDLWISYRECINDSQLP